MEDAGREVADVQRPERRHCGKAMSSSFATLSKSSDEMDAKKNGGLWGTRSLKNRHSVLEQ